MIRYNLHNSYEHLPLYKRNIFVCLALFNYILLFVPVYFLERERERERERETYL
jgi:hypothetical protein